MGLREIRQAKGLTLMELAEKSKPANIALKTAVKLAKALDCRPEDILK